MGANPLTAEQDSVDQRIVASSSSFTCGVVLNDLDRSLLPVDLGAGWELDRARPEEVAIFRPGFLRLSSAGDLSSSSFPPRHECTLTEIPQPSGGVGYQFQPISDAMRWRYCVLRPTNEGESMLAQRLHEILRVADDDLWVEEWAVQREELSGALRWASARNAPRAAQYFINDPAPLGLPQTIDPNGLRRVIHQRQHLDDAAYPQIARCLTRLRELDLVPNHSDTKTLAYFGIIEGLLAHNPAANDTIDTITRQLKRNLILVDHRMPAEKGLGLDGFEGVNADTVIGKLYAYRSDVAHGTHPAKAEGWLNEHRPAAWANQPPSSWLHSFLRRLVQRVLQAALAEPQLITDVRG
jgi:hypothetical protein